jgi:hypothetical protein
LDAENPLGRDDRKHKKKAQTLSPRTAKERHWPANRVRRMEQKRGRIQFDAKNGATPRKKRIRSNSEQRQRKKQVRRMTKQRK